MTELKNAIIPVDYFILSRNIQKSIRTFMDIYEAKNDLVHIRDTVHCWGNQDILSLWHWFDVIGTRKETSGAEMIEISRYKPG